MEDSGRAQHYETLATANETRHGSSIGLVWIPVQAHNLQRCNYLEMFSVLKKMRARCAFETVRIA